MYNEAAPAIHLKTSTGLVTATLKRQKEYPVDLPPSHTRIRHKQRAEKTQLALVQAFIAICRVGFRCMEFIGPPKRRQKMRQFREKMRAIEEEKNTVLQKIKTGKSWEGSDAVPEMAARHSWPEDSAQVRGSQAYLRAIREESDALQSIGKDSDGDKSLAAQGFRDYIAAHPNSHMARSYLGGTLEQIGDLDGCIREYRESIRLAGNDSIPGAASRLRLGEVLRQKGETEAAINEFRSIIEEASIRTKMLVCMAFYQLGISLDQVGERKEARAAWKQAIQWDETKVIAKKAQELLQSNP